MFGGHKKCRRGTKNFWGDTFCELNKHMFYPEYTTVLFVYVKHVNLICFAVSWNGVSGDLFFGQKFADTLGLYKSLLSLGGHKQ